MHKRDGETVDIDGPTAKKIDRMIDEAEREIAERGLCSCEMCRRMRERPSHERSNMDELFLKDLVASLERIVLDCVMAEEAAKNSDNNEVVNRMERVKSKASGLLYTAEAHLDIERG